MKTSRAFHAIAVSFFVLAGGAASIVAAEDSAMASVTTTCTTAAFAEYAFSLDNQYGQELNRGPETIVTGPDGDLWFTETFTGGIGAISPSTFAIREYALTPNSNPAGIAAGSDGNIWFTEGETTSDNGSGIGRMSTQGHLLGESLVASEPAALAPAPNGNLWFAGSTLGQISTSGSIVPVLTEFGVAEGVVEGPDGNVWFTSQDTQNNTGYVNRVTPSGAVTTTPLLATTSGGLALPWGITVGPDKNIWVVGNYIWKISTSGEVLGTYPTPETPMAFEPAAIVAGSDGNLWFTENATNHLGAISTTGTLVATPWTLTGAAYGITSGPDGALWFTEFNGNKIGRVMPSICTTTTCIEETVCESSTGQRIPPTLSSGSSWCSARGGHMVATNYCTTTST
jgi:streptogramin lyase